jgi:hypothetical protein
MVLDLRSLKPEEQQNAVGSPAMSLAPCVYDRTEKQRLIQSVLGGFIEKVAHLYRRVQDQWRSKVDYQLWATVRRQSNLVFDLPTYGETVQNEFHRTRRAVAKEAQRELLRLAITFQDQALREEREWRLVILGAEPSTVEKEPGPEALNSGPEHAVNLKKAVDLRAPGGRLAVTRVWAESASVEEVRKILEKNGYSVQLVEQPR